MMNELWAKEFTQQCVVRMNESTERVVLCLTRMPADKIWQRPNSQLSSIGNLVLHLCGNITQYVLSSLGGLPDVRVRQQEFDAQGGYTVAELTDMMQHTADKACAVMNNCSWAELLRNRWVQGFELTGIGICIHVVEHYSYHTGQIAWHTKLHTGEDLGFYAGMNLNIVN